MNILTRMALASVVAVAVSANAGAQLQQGDVVVSAFFVQNNAFNQGAIVYFDPMNPTAISTLSSEVVAGSFHNWVRMAPNNMDLIVAEVPSTFASTRLVQIDPGGLATTLAGQVPGSVEGLELDGDNQFIAISALPAASTVLEIDATSGAMRTLILASGVNDLYNDVAIVREGGVHYAIANFTLSSVSALPKLLNADRTGIRSTLLQSLGNPLEQISAIEMDPRSGDLIVTDFDGPGSTEPNGTEVSRVSLGGSVTTLVSFVGANAAKVAQDDTVYVAGYTTQGTALTNAVLRYDLRTSAVLTIFAVNNLASASWALSGIEIYGSQALTCNGTGGPSSTIQIALNSQAATAPSAGYQIACSLGRRPGVTLPNGERLHLNALDGLFVLTAQNLAPTIFRRFSGTLDPFGSATASVVLPASFPTNLGVTVFCAAVVFSQGNIIQVTNTHWFEL